MVKGGQSSGPCLNPFSSQLKCASRNSFINSEKTSHLRSISFKRHASKARSTRLFLGFRAGRHVRAQGPRPPARFDPHRAFLSKRSFAGLHLCGPHLCGQPGDRPFKPRLCLLMRLQGTASTRPVRRHAVISRRDRLQPVRNFTVATGALEWGIAWQARGSAPLRSYGKLTHVPKELLRKC